MSELIPKETKAVFFDWDDCLVATIKNKWPEHKHIARTFYDKELSDEELRQHWGKPLHEMLSLIYETEDIDLALERIREVKHDFPKVLFDHSIGVVERIRAKNKIVGLITATSRFALNFDLEDLGIPSNLFDYTQASDESIYHKPDPRVFGPALSWLKRFNIQAHETLYVGDGIKDFKAASEAGLQFIGVETGLVSIEQFREVGAVAVKDLIELVPA